MTTSTKRETRKTKTPTETKNPIEAAVNEFAESVIQKRRQDEIDGQLKQMCNGSSLKYAAERVTELAEKRDRLLRSIEQQTSLTLQRDLINVVDQIRRTFESAAHIVRAEQAKPASFSGLPDSSTKDLLVNELLSLYDDYDEVNVDKTTYTVSVITEPIELLYNFNHCDIVIGMGSFKISLSLRDEVFRLSVRSAGGAVYNPEDGFSHPHVQPDGRSCLGDADEAAKLAARDLRVSDAFNLVKAVLNDYNSSSPHKQLWTWLPHCEQCQRKIDKVTRCGNCHKPMCSYCPPQKCEAEKVKVVDNW